MFKKFARIYRELFQWPAHEGVGVYDWLSRGRDAIPVLAVLAGGGVGLIRGWVDGVWAGFAVGALGVCFLAGAAIWRLTTKLDKYEAVPKPQILFDGFSPVYDQPQRGTIDGHPYSSAAEFVRVQFVNISESRGESANIADLHATIEFLRGDTSVLVVPDGRWADNEDRGTAPSKTTKSVPIPGTGESRVLDIAMRPQNLNLAECFGWDNDGRLISNPVLSPGRYRVNVDLDASNMETASFSFLLVNNGADANLELSEFEGVSNPCSDRWRKSKQLDVHTVVSVRLSA